MPCIHEERSSPLLAATCRHSLLLTSIAVTFSHPLLLTATVALTSLTVTYRYFSRETTCAKPSREMDGMKPPKEASGPKMEVVASRYGSSAKLREKRSSKEYAISADPATQSTAGAQGQGAQAQSNARAREHAQPDGDRRLQSLRERLALGPPAADAGNASLADSLQA